MVKFKEQKSSGLVEEGGESVEITNKWDFDPAVSKKLGYNFFEERKHFPDNFLVNLKSTFKTYRCKTTVEGLGTLIFEDMIITCAHNVYYFIDIIRSRKKADEVEVWIPGQGRIKVRDYRFPE